MTFQINGKNVEVNLDNGIATVVKGFKEYELYIIKDVHKKSITDIFNELENMMGVG